MSTIFGGTRLTLVPFCITVGTWICPSDGMGQMLPTTTASTATTAAVSREVPASGFFPVGERLEYAITVGRIRLGRATMRVEAVERLDGVRTYRTSLHIRIGAALLNYEDRLVSWIEPEPFQSRGFARRDSDDGDLLRYYRFDPESGNTSAERRTPDGEFVEPVDPPADIPVGVLDELAALYLLRTLSLEVGETRTLDRYFDTSVAPMEVSALGRERTRVPAGRFDVTVYRAVMPALPSFEAEDDPLIHVSEDDARLIVMIETDTKVGRMQMYLTDYEILDSGLPEP